MIDDNAPVRELFKSSLNSEGYEVYLAHNGEEGIELYHQENPDVVFVDMGLPGKDGLEVIKELKSYDNGARIIAISGIFSEEIAEPAKEAGALSFLQKPFKLQDLSKAIEDVMGEE